MNHVTCIKNIAIAALLAASGAACDRQGGAGDGGEPGVLPIGRMKVSLMPEYDDAGMLVVYEGRFEAAPRYPIRASFLVPRGSVINDACSLSHEGQHFCQLYSTVNRGSHDEVRTQLPYPNYYLSFHTPALEARAGRKQIDYLVKASHPVRLMEVDIQQPLRSSGFAVSAPQGAMASAPGGAASVVKGFNHFLYRLENVAAGEQSAFGIRYEKSDPNPSVDIKYASMRESQPAAAPYEAQRNVKTAIYLLFGTGALGVLALGAWLLRSARSRRGRPQ